MKKSWKGLISLSLEKIRQHKERLKKLSFSSHQEDFVITEQEEREGGFFGKNYSPLKINKAI